MAHKDPAVRREYQKRWRAAHPGAQKGYDLRRSEKSGIPRKIYLRGYQRKYRWRVMGLPTPTRPEPEQCECCGRLPKKTLHLDHDHLTGVFRGWVCGSCNLGMGSLGDDIAGLEKALAYLSRVK